MRYKFRGLGAAATAAATATSIAVGFPSTARKGDTVIVRIASKGTSAVGIWVPPAGWLNSAQVLAGNATASTAGKANIAEFYKIFDPATDTGFVTFTRTAGQNGAVAIARMVAYGGIDVDNPRIAGAGGNISNATTAIVRTVTIDQLIKDSLFTMAVATGYTGGTSAFRATGTTPAIASSGTSFAQTAPPAVDTFQERADDNQSTSSITSLAFADTIKSATETGFDQSFQANTATAGVHAVITAAWRTRVNKERGWDMARSTAVNETTDAAGLLISGPADNSEIEFGNSYAGYARGVYTKNNDAGRRYFEVEVSALPGISLSTIQPILAIENTESGGSVYPGPTIGTQFYTGTPITIGFVVDFTLKLMWATLTGGSTWVGGGNPATNSGGISFTPPLYTANFAPAFKSGAGAICLARLKESKTQGFTMSEATMNSIGAQPWFDDVIALQALGIASAATLGAPALNQTHALQALGVNSQATIDKPALTVATAMTARGLLATAALGRPTLSQVHNLSANGLASSAALGTPALSQTHALSAANLASTAVIARPAATIAIPLPAPRGLLMTAALGKPALGQTHALSATGLASIAQLGTPALFSKKSFDPSDASEYLLELNALDENDVPVVLRIGTCAYVTKPDDTPANTKFYDGLINPGEFSQNLFGEMRSRGESGVGYGSIVISNADGKWDNLLKYAVAGRPFTIKRLPGAKAPWMTAQIIQRGIAESVDSNNALSELSLNVYDQRRTLEKPLLTERYAGTTTSGPSDTAEGNEDLKDQVKPKSFGADFNIQGIAANPYDLFYQYSAGPLSSIVLRDGGAPLTNVGDFPTLLALRTALQNGTSIRPGQYGTVLSLGIAGVRSVPDFALTADIRQAAGASAHYPGSVIRRVLTHAGKVAGVDYVDADLVALDAAAPYECTCYVDNDDNIDTVINRVLSSIGGWMVPDGTGMFRFGRHELPAAPVASFSMKDIHTGTLDELLTMAENPDTENVPIYRIVLNYLPLGITQEARDLVKDESMTEATKQYYAAETRQVKSEDLAVLARYPMATELVVDTCLVNAADAQAECDRLLALYKVKRRAIVIALERPQSTFKLGETVTITLDTPARLGMENGRMMRAIGRREARREEIIEHILWG